MIDPRRFALVIVPLVLGACDALYDYPSPSAEVCTNGIDDDFDGLVDCDDPDCDGKCTEEGTRCFDGRDNDGDGRIDADDVTCWSARTDVVLERCATVKGTALTLGTTIGVDWVVVGAADPPAVETTLPDGTVVLSSTSTLQSSKVTTGKLGGAVVTARLYARSALDSPFAEQTVALQPDGELPSLAFDFSTGHVDLSGTQILAVPLPSVCPAFNNLELVVSDDGLTITVSVDGRPGVEVPMPDGWTATTPFSITWSAGVAGGIVSASVSRKDYQRCDGPAPDPATYRSTQAGIAASAWLPGGHACVTSILGDVWAADASAGDVSASLAPAGHAPDGTRITALAWDAAAHLLRGLTQDRCDETTGACQLTALSPPHLVSAPGCSGPWHDDGVMFTDKMPLLVPLGYGIVDKGPPAERHEILFAVPTVGNAGVYESKALLASSPDGSPGSYTTSEPDVALGVVAPAVARVGNDWLELTAADDRSLQLGILGSHSPLAKLEPSHETATFDGAGYECCDAPDSRRAALAFDTGAPARGVAYVPGAKADGTEWGPVRITVAPK